MDYAILLRILIPFTLAGIITLVILSASGRKKIVTHSRNIGKASAKVLKAGEKKVGGWLKKPESKQPQLPSNGKQVNNPTPVFTPNKQPKQEVIIPLPAYNIDPTYGFGNVEIKYFEGCNGYTLFETGPNGESLAFECVAGYDERTDKYTIWFYKVKYHRDTRKKSKNNQDYDLWERVS